MKYTDRHNKYQWCNSLMMGLLLAMLLCLSACSSGDDDNNGNSNGNSGKVPTKLYIYVYAPQLAESTRATYDGDVDPIDREASVYTLKIWVFTHTNHKLIGYYAPTEIPGLSKDHPYELIQLTIDEDYANTPAATRENVDVYVVGNITAENANVTLDETTTQAQLEDALMAKTTTLDPYGVTNLVTSVPINIGLPMSGVLRNQPVTGNAPVLRLDNSSEIAKVQLIRMVSKVRFAFCRQTGSEDLHINSIKLNSSMIPMAEYVFMAADAPYDRHTCHIKTASGYDESSELLAEAITEVPTHDTPVIYAWGNDETEEPRFYEKRLDDAAAAGKLVQRLYYLRESDKLLQGTIKYQIGTDEEKTTTFQMVDVGGFSRNHQWTVYVYAAEARLHVIVAETAPWQRSQEEYDFYNW